MEDKTSEIDVCMCLTDTVGGGGVEDICVWVVSGLMVAMRAKGVGSEGWMEMERIGLNE